MRAGAGKSKDEKDKAASYYKAEGMKLFRKGGVYIVCRLTVEDFNICSNLMDFIRVPI